MSLPNIVVGQVGQYQAATVPTGSVLPTGVIPQWTSSDFTIASVESPNSDATGFTIKVTGVAGGTFTLTVSATLPDGSVPQGSITDTIAAGEVKSFVITRLS